jgi:cytochrome o ubiquinol oxidase subunit II
MLTVFDLGLAEARVTGVLNPPGTNAVTKGGLVQLDQSQRQQRPVLRRGAWSAIALAPRYGILLAPLAVAACQSGILNPKGPIGDANKQILIDSLAIMLAIVVPTIAAALGCAWWYRSSNQRARRLPGFVFSGQIELITWAIPLLTITLLGGVAWVGSHDLDPARPLPSRNPPLNVQVVSLDWKWLFIYPDQHVASVNRLVIPVGVPIRFALTSGSVMTAFFVPQLGSMIYTMNGMRTQLNLRADSPGVFLGVASHYSGNGFSTMHFDVEALPASRFSAWVDATRGGGPTLTGESYKDLAKQSLSVAPFTYRDVDPNLFQKIVTQVLPPGPGPIPVTNPGAPKQAEQ